MVEFVGSAFQVLWVYVAEPQFARPQDREVCRGELPNQPHWYGSSGMEAAVWNLWWFGAAHEHFFRAFQGALNRANSFHFG